MLSHRRHATLPLLLISSIVVLAGSSTAVPPVDRGNAPYNDARRSSAPDPWETVYHEHDFKGNPRSAARPDSLLVLDLEPRGERQRHRKDSGPRGIDRIPFEFEEAMEREVCWDGGEPFSGEPHEIVLRDSRQREILRVREGGPCVTAHIEAGRHQATFYAGQDRDAASRTVFMRPAEMFAGPVDGPPDAIDSTTGPGDPGSQPPCAVPANITTIAKTEAPTIGTSLQPGEVALFFDGPSGQQTFDYLPIPASCPSLQAALGALNMDPSIRTYRTIVVPSQGRSVALYYLAENFLGPRLQVPDSCQCKQAGCTDCPVSNARLIDPLFHFFNCLSLNQRGMECTLPPAFTLSASLSLLDANAQNGDILISTRTCTNCDFRYSDALRGQNLSNVNVAFSDFTNADLSGTILNGADAHSAIFDSVVTDTPVDLSNAKLAGARFGYERTVIPLTQQVIFNRAAQLQGALYRNSDLSGATFPRARLFGADFSNADLSQAGMRRSDLSALLPAPPDTDFCEAPADDVCEALGTQNCAAGFDGALATDVALEGARMVGVSMRGTDLSNAMLDGVEAYAADFGPDAAGTSTRLDGTSFALARLRCPNFDRAVGSQTNFTDARMTHAFLGKAALPRAILSGAQLDPANLGGVNLTDATLTISRDGQVGPAKLTNAYMKDAILDGANLSGADLSFVSWYSLSSTSSELRAGARDGAVMSGTVLTCARLQHIELDGSTLRGANLSSASLSGASLQSSGGNPVDLGPFVENSENIPSRLVRADLRAADLSGANLTGADLTNAPVLSSDSGLFGVWAAADPGHYDSPLVLPPDSECTDLAGNMAWEDQQTCVAVTGDATKDPLVTTPSTTCPSGSKFGAGCGVISPLNPAWNPTPPPQPPIGDCDPFS
jgi:uncharacterized protein YjbI with pentapeptide repeats